MRLYQTMLGVTRVIDSVKIFRYREKAITVNLVAIEELKAKTDSTTKVEILLFSFITKDPLFCLICFASKAIL